LPRLRRRAGASGSDLSASEPGSRIDFTNPAAVQWYQGLLAELFRMGAAAIKTDFGENIDMDAEYFGMSAGRLRNLYALLYQKAAFEATARAVEHPLIWARAAWAGCQRYPVHWGGDAASTWDGMAASLRGGLHFGLSGFGFWSHDVPGFHGVPDFMNSRPSSTLYVRWTQFGVLSSHLRYHGASAREPWEYPDVLEIVRGWLRLRYALIPYLMRCGAETVTGGAPVLRALVFHDLADPVCWHVDDQFLCGPSLLAAPVMNDSGTRDIYLPAGDWVDFWTGQRFQGPRWIRAVTSPLHRMPLFAVRGSRIPVYPIRVACTDEMDPSRTVELTFDHGYGGMGASLLGPLTGLS
ncbi:MAG TPA: glycoside hydrolase family 31 protein, partial [bacterium]|nr:glycoside hydrolase family 31 protein [bacterium]